MRLGRAYDPNLRSCGLHGHITYRPDEVELAQRLRTDTTAGEAWRCLRCAAYVPGPPHGSGPAEDAPLVLRGDALTDAVILRLLGTERLIRGLLLVALGYAIYRFEGSRDALQREFKADLPLLKPLADKLGYDLRTSGPIHLIEKAFTLHHNALVWVMLGVFCYAGLQFAEGIGLWLLKRWGEYVAVVGTSVFIPLEVYELAHHVTVLKILAFIVNVAAVVYLVWSKRLFGLRGGYEAFEASRHSASLLEVEEAASQKR